MQGRRRATRFSFFNSEGVLTVSHDVVVQTGDAGTLVVIDVEARTPGELVTLDWLADGKIVRKAVEVVSCRPIVRGGDVLHELVMKPAEEHP